MPKRKIQRVVENDLGLNQNESTVLNFARTFNSCDTIEEVAGKLGISPKYVQMKASTLRGLGIQLKDMRRGRDRTVDVKKLNELLQ